MRPNIEEKTESEVIVLNTRKFFNSVYAETAIIPASYDGKYACLLAVAVNTQLTEAQMDALETAIEEIAGIHKAFCLIGPARIPLDRVPAGNDLRIGVEGSFTIRATEA